MDDEIDADQVSTLIGHIYDCAIDPAAWPVAMEAMRVQLNCQTSSLDLVTLPEGDRLLNVMTNIPERHADRMLELAGESIELWGGMHTLQALPFDEPAVLTRVTGRTDGWDNPLYTEWAKPQGLCDVLAIFVARDSGAFGVLGFGRHLDIGPVDDRAVRLARLLVPHLQRAATINRLLNVAALQLSTFDALFDAFSAPIVIVGAGAAVAHVNKAARRLMDRGDIICLRGSFLSATHRSVSLALTVAIDQAVGDPGNMERKGLGIPALHADGSATALYVLPLSSFSRDKAERRLAAVFLAAPSSQVAPPALLISALFGLTPAEAAVFRLIAEGRKISQIADHLAVERSTIKTHLLRVFDKTGVRRQAELVQIAASLMPGLLF